MLERRRVVAVLMGATIITGLILAPIQARPQVGRTNATTPELIENAVRDGRINRRVANLFLAYALAAPNKLPAAYRSDVPWRGTLPLLHLRNALQRMGRGPVRTEIQSLVHPSSTGERHCDISDAPLPQIRETANFYIEYRGTALGGGLTIDDYVESLETAWVTEVDSFGWAAPPIRRGSPAPGMKYHVRIDTLGPTLYGFVSSDGTHAGFVGNNPHTSWDDRDAIATCMVLNSDFGPFPGTSQQALDATTAHEFNHSIQFGYGGLTGANRPDDVFTEGGATWMEDEVFDDANDNYNYLWPDFDDDMGTYRDSPYPYWVTFRGLTERYGTGIAGGGEAVLQRFWEHTSRMTGNNLTAMNKALIPEGTTLARAFHDYAIAVRFNMACTAQYVYPYCFQEGPNYVSAAGATSSHATISAVGGSRTGVLPDNYALNWINLPVGPIYSVMLTNTSDGGELRATIVCDTGSAFTLQAMPATVGAGKTTWLPRIHTDACSRVVSVITNQSQTGANPSTSPGRSYVLATGAPGPLKCPGLRGVSGNHVVGTSRNDVMPGTNGADVMCGLGGGDKIVGRSGSDIIQGGGGADSAKGEGGPDTLVGNRGADDVLGGAGADRLNIRDGIRGNDTAGGGPGIDGCRKDRRDRIAGCER
jgi:Ca2+-binding RTX toxin-like protein